MNLSINTGQMGEGSGKRRGRPAKAHLRLGVYVDGVFRFDGGRLYANSMAFPFMLFIAEVGRGFGETVCIGRTVTSGAGTDFVLPPGLRLVPLPYYENLRRVGSVLRSLLATLAGMWRALDEVDVVWAFGPHPLSLALATLALLRRRRVVLGVRQDTMSYFRARAPGLRWAPVRAALHVVDWAFRGLARFAPAIVVGGALERRYGGPRPRLMRTTVSLTASSDLVAAPATRDWDGVKDLLTAGRIEPEKSPLLLIEALAELNRRRPGEYRLIWAGTGQMAGEVRARAASLGIAHGVKLPGFVPYGPDLVELYRGAHAFVHVSVTEGSPQVLVEAMAAGIPIVATDVGSVREALEDGGAGLIVPPNDRDAVVDAILELTDDASRRLACVERGLVIARRHARDVEAAKVAEFIVAHASQAAH